MDGGFPRRFQLPSAAPLLDSGRFHVTFIGAVVAGVGLSAGRGSRPVCLESVPLSDFEPSVMYVPCVIFFVITFCEFVAFSQPFLRNCYGLVNSDCQLRFLSNDKSFSMLSHTSAQRV